MLAPVTGLHQCVSGHSCVVRIGVERVISRFAGPDAQPGHPYYPNQQTASGRTGRLPDAEGSRSEGVFRVACRRWATAAFERFASFRRERRLSENQRKRFGS